MKKKDKKIEDQSRRYNIQIIRSSGRRENRVEEIISEITQEDFPELKDISFHIERA